MFLYGASGHAKVIIDILRAGHESIEALFDDNVEVTSWSSRITSVGSARTTDRQYW